MWLNGEPLSPTTTYSVTVNSFLAAGGDNFREFANGTDKADTGQIDLQAMVDYMEEFAADEPLAVDYAQHSVGATVTDETIDAVVAVDDRRERRRSTTRSRSSTAPRRWAPSR